jgi:hypothetical protein
MLYSSSYVVILLFFELVPLLLPGQKQSALHMNFSLSTFYMSTTNYMRFGLKMGHP